MPKNKVFFKKITKLLQMCIFFCNFVALFVYPVFSQ